jgi:hypothetical protein
MEAISKEKKKHHGSGQELFLVATTHESHSMVLGCNSNIV